MLISTVKALVIELWRQPAEGGRLHSALLCHLNGLVQSAVVKVRGIKAKKKKSTQAVIFHFDFKVVYQGVSWKLVPEPKTCHA